MSFFRSKPEKVNSEEYEYLLTRMKTILASVEVLESKIDNMKSDVLLIKKKMQDKIFKEEPENSNSTLTNPFDGVF